MEALHELLQVLVNPCVMRDVVHPVLHLLAGGQLAVEEEVGNLEVAGALGELLDGISAVAQEGGVVREEPEVVGADAELAEIHGADGAVDDGQVRGLAGAVVGDRHCARGHGGPSFLFTRRVTRGRCGSTRALVRSSSSSTCCYLPRTVSTGQGAAVTTREATLPRKNLANPVRPWVPMTIRSAFFDLAARMICAWANPSSRMTLTLTPDARALSRSVASCFWACLRAEASRSS